MKLKNKLSLIIIGALCLSIGLGCRWFGSKKDDGKIDIKIDTSGKSKNETVNTGSTSNTSSTSVTATELYKAYKDNKAKADAVYKDKTLRLSGVIDVVGKDLVSGSSFVSLKPADSRYNAGVEQLQIFFKSSESSKLGSLKAGQSIEVLGRCAGMTGNIVIRDAVFQ